MAPVNSENGARSEQAGAWRTAIFAVGGLLLAVVLAGIVGLLLNNRLQSATDEAFYVLDLEDEGDDMRVAVLNLRDLHKSFLIAGPSRGGVNEFDAAFAELEEELNELAEIGVRDSEAPQPEEISQVAEAYYRDFRIALLDLEREDPEFIDAADQGLIRLSNLAQAAEAIDELGEELTEDSLESVDRTSETTAIVLIGVLLGLLFIGGGLAFAAIRVVGELRELYAQQAAATVALERAAEVKNDFIADISHELRTPLTVLRANAEIATMVSEEKARNESLGEIVGETERISRLVDDLMFLARSDTATLPIEKERISITPFLAEVAERSRKLVGERGIEFVHDVSVEGEIIVDPGRIEQTILILVDNAAKFSPPDAPVTMTAAIEKQEKELCVEVADTGPGIDAQEIPLIFERFYKVAGKRGRREGTGLGLAIASTIANLHGGRLEVQSAPGEGTTMQLFVPLAESVEAVTPD